MSPAMRSKSVELILTSTVSLSICKNIAAFCVDTTKLTLDVFSSGLISKILHPFVFQLLIMDRVRGVLDPVPRSIQDKAGVPSGSYKTLSMGNMGNFSNGS